MDAKRIVEQCTLCETPVAIAGSIGAACGLAMEGLPEALAEIDRLRAALEDMHLHAKPGSEPRRIADAALVPGK